MSRSSDLEQGRGAGFKASSHFRHEPIWKRSSETQQKCCRFLGNLNNQIILRLEDSDTAQWFSDKVGGNGHSDRQCLKQHEHRSESHAMEISMARSRVLCSWRKSAYTIRLIHSLPNLQYFHADIRGCCCTREHSNNRKAKTFMSVVFKNIIRDHKLSTKLNRVFIVAPSWTMLLAARRLYRREFPWRKTGPLAKRDVRIALSGYKPREEGGQTHTSRL